LLTVVFYVSILDGGESFFISNIKYEVNFFFSKIPQFGQGQIVCSPGGCTADKIHKSPATNTRK
jgi:hypothetical protein